MITLQFTQTEAEERESGQAVPPLCGSGATLPRALTNMEHSLASHLDLGEPFELTVNMTVLRVDKRAAVFMPVTEFRLGTIRWLGD